jgi:serine/threonine-protein kinase
LVGTNESAGLLDEVIAKEPSFAPAYAALAAAHAARSGEFRFNLADEMVKMRAAAEKAIQLDPLLAAAHDALGMVYARDAQWQQSEKSFRRAMELNHNGPQAYLHFSLFVLLPLGRIPEALECTRAAEKMGRLSPAAYSELAYVLIAAGQYNEAAEQCEKLPADFPDSGCLCRVRLAQGRIGESIKVLEAALNKGVRPGAQVRGELGNAYARAGRREDAEKLLDDTSPVNPFNRALIYAGLGDKDHTLEALDRAARGGPFRIGRALTFPEFALLRGDPRVNALSKKVGLPD